MLILGIDPDCLTKYVEEVMVAKSHLVKMGWNVAGAFISAIASESSKPGKSAVPNAEYTKFVENHEAIAPEITKWIKIANADVLARNSTELLNKNGKKSSQNAL